MMELLYGDGYDALKILYTAICAISIPVLFYVFSPALLARSIHDGGLGDTNVKETVLIEGEGETSMEKEAYRSMLSFVIPAYNEELRLPIMLNETLSFLEKKGDEVVKTLAAACKRKHACGKSLNRPFEVLLIDDGSSDNTSDVFKRFVNKNKSTYSFATFRLIRLTENRGKGAALKAGMIRARSEFSLMVDADGATDINDLLSLSRGMNTHQIVIGSRAHLAKKSKAKRTFVRNLLMIAFHFFVSILCSASINDTQCGFKLFTREASYCLFSNLHLQRWAFDTEIIILAEKLKIPMNEIGVNWQEIEGSKLDTSKFSLIVASVGMLRDMICVNLCYSLGIWKFPSYISADVS